MKEPLAYIYKATCSGNGKFYIGGTAFPIKKRWYQHLFLLRKGKHYNKRLQADFSEYGEAAFKVQEVESCSREALSDREVFWINELGATDKAKGYNRICMAVKMDKERAARVGRPPVDRDLRTFCARVMPEVYSKLCEMRQDEWQDFLVGHFNSIKPKSQVEKESAEERHRNVDIQIKCSEALIALGEARRDNERMKRTNYDLAGQNAKLLEEVEGYKAILG